MRRALLTDRVEEAVSPVLSRDGYEIVLVEYVPRSQILRLFIDHERGITLDDCTKVSHLVGDILDGDGISDWFDEVVTADDVEAYPWPDPVDPGRFEGMKERATQIREVERRAVFVGSLCAGVTEMHFRMRGYEDGYMDMAGYLEGMQE